MFRPKDRDSGQSREYAFITYEDEESVPYALDLYQDTQLYGRTIRMQVSGGLWLHGGMKMSEL